jgi:glycerate dehydrogenase
MRIVALDGHALNPGDNPWDPVAALGDLVVHDRTPPELVPDRAAGAHIVLTNKAPLPAGTLGRLEELKFVSVTATGYNVVDVSAARYRGVVVSNVPEYATDCVAQFVFALLLELCHRAGYHNALVRAGQWAQCPDFCFWNWPLRELAGKRMGIVGLGRIGRRVGRIAHAFGMSVAACDPARPAGCDCEPFEWMELEDLFAAADVVSLHCPQSDQTLGMVAGPLLARMKPSAILINTARGGLVDEQALADALNAGRLAAAAVDVVSAEPIRPHNPLLSARNCLITPHIAWAALEARRRLMSATAENVAAFLAGKPINVVS